MTAYDLIVIGGGSGGIATAARAAYYGAKCAIIESNELGGTCVNRGCIPKKVMWYAAAIAEMLQLAPDYGFTLQETSFDWQRLVENRERYIQRIRQWYTHYIAQHQITPITDHATLSSGKTVRVNEQQFTAKHIVIATGSKPAIPMIPGAHLGITSDGFFTLKQQPKRIAIVGGGYIAVELASLLRLLGSEVFLILRGNRPLHQFDPMLTDALVTAMQQQGIHLLTERTLSAVVKSSHGLQLVFQDNHPPLDGLEQVVWAIGRTPNTQVLGPAAGILLNSRGEIITDAYQNTNQEGIYAVGDVTGKLPLTPVAIAAGRQLAKRLFANQQDAKLDYTTVPTVIFTHPPIATVGLSEPDALAKFGADAVKVYQTQFKPMLTAVNAHEQVTKIKLVTVGNQETVVGCHIIGLAADEMLQGFAVAIKMGATKADFDTTVAIHPTSAEEVVLLR